MLLVSYCIEPVGEGGLATPLAPSDRHRHPRRAELPALELLGERLRARCCCFTASVRLPPDETPGKCAVYLTVQNVNPTPDGTPTDQAATVIGGHLLSRHTLAGTGAEPCAAIMLLDHAFDVI